MGSLLRNLFVGWSLCAAVQAGQCTAWVNALSTDPTVPKGFSGDTHAAYGLFAFWGDPDTKLVVRGRFARARFMSVQTYETRFQKNIDAILDYEIEPDAGSVNPFRGDAIPVGMDRKFTLELVPEKYFANRANEIKLPDSRLAQSFFFRIYAPDDGVTITEADLPSVEAVDVRTGAAVACPAQGPGKLYLGIPQFVVNLAGAMMPFEFKSQSNVIGSNAGIPSYLYALEKFSEDEVLVVRFKAPTYGLDAEVRYWSLCLQNFVKNETRWCLPDRFAEPDRHGMVTVVLGKGDDVKARAQARGFHFAGDPRAKNQTTLGFAYRNVLPNERFAESQMYRGDYRPTARKFSKAEFLAD